MSRLSRDRLPSQLFRNAVENKRSNLTIQDLINACGTQSFGLIFIVMALPLTVPLPPGVGFIPAALICIWSIQRALGGTLLWVPKAVSKREIPQEIIRQIELRAIPLCEKLEKFFFNSSQSSMLKESEIRLASSAVILMSMLIMLPTPFLNTIPAVIIILLGLTILYGNRKLLWINVSFGLLALGFIGSTLYMGAEVLFEEINDFFLRY